MSTFGLILFAVLLSCGWGLLGVVIGSLFRLSLSDALVSGLTAIGIVVVILALAVGQRLGRRRHSRSAPAKPSQRGSRHTRSASPSNSSTSGGEDGEA